MKVAIVRSFLWTGLLLTLPVFSCPFGVIRALASMHETTVDLSLANNNPFGPSPVGATTPSASRNANWAIAVLAVHLLVQLLIGVFGVRRACYKLRHASRYYAPEHVVTNAARLKKWERHPPVPEGSPLVWKEVHLSGQTPRLVRMLTLVPWWLWLALSVTIMIVGLAATLSSTDSVNVMGTINDMVRWVGGIALGLMGLMVGLHAAGSVARERQQETLTDLLMVPRARREVLRAKWIGSFSKARAVVLATVAIPVVGVLTEGIALAALPMLLFAAFAYLACATSLGIWISVRATSVQRATGLWLLVVCLWLGGTWLAAETGYMDQRQNARANNRWVRADDIKPLVWDRVTCPPLAWSHLCFRFRHGEASYWFEQHDGIIQDIDEAIPALVGAGSHLLLAWALFKLASRRFERDGR